jgi:hypothetical protein
MRDQSLEGRREYIESIETIQLSRRTLLPTPVQLHIPQDMCYFNQSGTLSHDWSYYSNDEACRENATNFKGGANGSQVGAIARPKEYRTRKNLGELLVHFVLEAKT